MIKRNLLGLIAATCSCLILLSCITTGQESVEIKPKTISLWFMDVHNHLVGRYGSSSRIEEIDYEGAARVALNTMNRLGIKKMLIMPPPFSPDHPNRYAVDDLISPVKKYPERFAFLGGGGTLNVMIQQAVQDGMIPPRLKSRFEETAKEILSKGALGFGELAVEHFSLNVNHPYESAPPDHSLFLVLSDIAARQDVPIDIHMEAIPEEMPLPKIRRLQHPRNPRFLRANLPAFERLLAHNRSTKIIWAHAGWCNTGRRTPTLCAQLLERNPNLFMSFKINPDSIPETKPLTDDFKLKPEWLHLIRTYPDRFVIGSDHFYVTPRANIQIGPPRKEGEGTERLLAQLPPDIARKVGYENALHIFKLESPGR